MKNAVKEFIELTSDEKQALWKNAIFVFDTNVLLNLYRYSESTRNSLLKAFESLDGRVWIPYQIAYEYMKNRCEVIYESVQRYDSLSNGGEKFVNEIKNSLRLSSEDKELDKLNQYIKTWLEKNKKRHLVVSNPSEDEILKRVLNLFDGKVGEEISEEDLEEIKKEGADRYKKEIPPGYKDAGKQNGPNDNNAYGDLIIWKQIMKYAAENNKDIIFVTHDQKEDWWYIPKGKTIGPRFELKKEFFKETNQVFHMYKMESFINSYNSMNAEQIEKSAVEEVANLNQYRLRPSVTIERPLSREYTKERELIELMQRQILIYNKELHDIRSKYPNFEDMPKEIHIKYEDIKRKKMIVHSLRFRLREKLKSEAAEMDFNEIKDYLLNTIYMDSFENDDEY